MQRQTDIEAINLGSMRLALHRRLRQLEAEQDRIVDAISETQRRIKVLDEVASWHIEEHSGEIDQGSPLVHNERHLEPRNGDANILVRPLAEAIVYLRRETPNITKAQVRQRLEAIGYRFGVNRSNVGRAIHAAWITADKRLAVSD